MPDIDSTLTKAPLARAVLEYIEANPDEWNQNFWAYADACGTVYCFAGHAVHMAHPAAQFLFGFGAAVGTHEAAQATIPAKDVPMRVDQVAQALLGLDRRSANIMFWSNNTLEHLRDYVEQMEQPDFNGRLTCMNPKFDLIDPYDEDES